MAAPAGNPNLVHSKDAVSVQPRDAPRWLENAVINSAGSSACRGDPAEYELSWMLELLVRP